MARAARPQPSTIRTGLPLLEACSRECSRLLRCIGLRSGTQPRRDRRRSDRTGPVVWPRKAMTGRSSAQRAREHPPRQRRLPPSSRRLTRRRPPRPAPPPSSLGQALFAMRCSCRGLPSPGTGRTGDTTRLCRTRLTGSSSTRLAVPMVGDQWRDRRTAWKIATFGPAIDGRYAVHGAYATGSRRHSHLGPVAPVPSLTEEGRHVSGCRTHALLTVGQAECLRHAAD